MRTFFTLAVTLIGVVRSSPQADCTSQVCDANAYCTGGQCFCNVGYYSPSTNPTVQQDCTAQCADNSDCGANAECGTTVTGVCECTSGNYSPSGEPTLNQDCKANEVCSSDDTSCGANAGCSSTAGPILCACNPGFFSPSGDPKKNKDCIAKCTGQSDCDPDANGNAVCATATGVCECTSGQYSPSGNPTGNLDCKANEVCVSSGSVDDSCPATATCDSSTGPIVCTCNSNFFSPSGDGKDCIAIEQCDGTNSCGANADCDDSSNLIECSCKPGYYSLSNDLEYDQDCASRQSIAKVQVEFTAGSDYTWESGALFYQSTDTLTDSSFMTAANNAVTNLATSMPAVRGSTMITIGSLTFEPNADDDTKVTTTMIVNYVWSTADIQSSSNSLAEDLIAELTNFFESSSAPAEVISVQGDMSHLVFTDATDYPTWGSWGAFSTCSDSCTKTREKTCDPTTSGVGNAGSEILCLEDPADPSTETESCNTETCHQLPCPSYCWSWSETEQKCSINEDHKCLEMECLATAINIYFKPELFNINEPGVDGTPTDLTEIFGTGTNVEWDSGNSRYKQECDLGGCSPTITTEDVSSVKNLAFEFKIAQEQTFTTLDNLEVLITPIAADVTLKCLYPATLDVTSAEMTVKGAAASGTTTKTGDLTDGFSLDLFIDDAFTTAVTADNVIIGYPIYAKMSWSVTSATASIQYHIEECSVTKSDTTDAIKIVRNNCYATVLGAQQLTATKMVDNDFTFKFISFMIKDSGATSTLEMDATVTCQVQMCLKSDSNCAASSLTQNDNDCTGGDSTLDNFGYQFDTYVAPFLI